MCDFGLFATATSKLAQKGAQPDVAEAGGALYTDMIYGFVLGAIPIAFTFALFVKLARARSRSCDTTGPFAALSRTLGVHLGKAKSALQPDEEVRPAVYVCHGTRYLVPRHPCAMVAFPSVLHTFGRKLIASLFKLVLRLAKSNICYGHNIKCRL